MKCNGMSSFMEFILNCQKKKREEEIKKCLNLRKALEDVCLVCSTVCTAGRLCVIMDRKH